MELIYVILCVSYAKKHLRVNYFKNGDFLTKKCILMISEVYFWEWKKLFAPPSFLQKKSSPPFLYFKKIHRPLFSPKKTLSPLFSSKKSLPPCRLSRPGYLINFGRSLTLYRRCLVKFNLSLLSDFGYIYLNLKMQKQPHFWHLRWIYYRMTV